MRIAPIAPLALAALLLSCAPRPRMCAAPGECGATSSCVAGRCQPNDGGTPVIAEQSDAGLLVRRFVVAPADVAWVRSGDRASGGAMPAVFTLGRDADGDALLFARFDLTLPKDAKIVEAYLLLARSDAVDVDPSPISLHAARIVDRWDSRSVSWAAQPRIEEVRAPTTRVDAGGRSLVRLDVRALVERWALHDRRDQGIAVVAENASATGMPFAFLRPGAPPGHAVQAPSPSPPQVGFGSFGFGPESRAASGAPVDVSAMAELSSPRLELYIK